MQKQGTGETAVVTTKKQTKVCTYIRSVGPVLLHPACRVVRCPARTRSFEGTRPSQLTDVPRCAKVRRWSRAAQPISGEYRLGSDGPVFPEISEFTWVHGEAYIYVVMSCYIDVMVGLRVGVVLVLLVRLGERGDTHFSGVGNGRQYEGQGVVIKFTRNAAAVSSFNVSSKGAARSGGWRRGQK